MVKCIDKDKELTCEDIEIILGIENNILHECNDNSQLVIEAYPKGEDYYGEILRRFNNQKMKSQRMISAEAKEALYNKPAEWNEEDEKFFKTALWHISNSISNGTNTDIHCDTTEWLKSLKERVQPQPKQEWSSSDERNLQGIIDEIEANKNQAPNYDIETYDRFLNWLKSLKNRYTWKPSDEQLDALEKECIAHSNYELCRLLEQLKKLKG